MIPFRVENESSLHYYSDAEVKINFSKVSERFVSPKSVLFLRDVSPSQMAQLEETRSKGKQNQLSAKRTLCPRDKTQFVFHLCTQTHFLTRGKISYHRLCCSCRNLSAPAPSVFIYINEWMKAWNSSLVLCRAQTLNYLFTASHLTLKDFKVV